MEEDAVALVPQGPVQMILAGGLPGLLVMFFAFVLFVMFIIGIIKRTDRFSLVYLGLAFVPFLCGMVGTFSGLVGAFGEIATNPNSAPSDLAAGVYVALMPNAMGAFISLWAVFSACLMLAFSRKKECEDAA